MDGAVKKHYDVVLNLVDTFEIRMRVLASSDGNAINEAKSLYEATPDEYRDKVAEHIDSKLVHVAVGPATADPDADEFECAICRLIYDNDVSRGLPSGQLICEECYGD